VNTAFHVITGVGLALCLIFVVAFHIKTGGAWWRSEAGRWLMLGRANMVLLFAAVTANRASAAFARWEGRQWVFLCLYGLFALQTFWPLRLLWHEEPLSKSKGENRDSRS
jgi:hypothetical protein